MNYLIDFDKSDKKTKKFKIVLTMNGKKKTIHFGSKNSKTYVEGASDKKREDYIKRHKVWEDWAEINPGSLSRFILWGDSNNLIKNLIQYLDNFKIEYE
jgi:hypothetical protein